MNEKRIVSADLLKWLALITMLIDHIGAGIIEKCYMPELRNFDIIVRLIGRNAFPIYCFLLLEGYIHTRNRWKYALNLLAFAIISEIPFDFMIEEGISWKHQNVFFTLLIGLFVMMVCGKIQEKNWRFGIFLEIITVLVLAVLADYIGADYGSWGVVLIYILFFFRNKPRWLLCLAGSIFLFTQSVEIAGIFAFVFIFLYNGKRNGNINKYVFYSLYSIHMIIYCGIRYLLML